MVAQDKKKEILKAASQCFAHYGYDKTTLEDIGKLVGLNKASLYYYYKNKDSIFSDVILFELEQFFITVLNKVSEKDNCKNKISAYLNERLKLTKYTGNLHQLVLENMKSFRPLVNEVIENIINMEVEYLSDILKIYTDTGEIMPCDEKKVARSIITVANAITNRIVKHIDYHLITEIDYSAIESETNYTISLILNGLLKKS